MKPVESTTIPITVESLEKLVRRIVGDALQSTAAFCRQMDELPTTGDEFLDKALDDLDPVAQVAIVALFARQVRTCIDEQLDAVRARLKAHVAKFQNPDRLRELCADADNAPAEEACRYWLAFGSK